MTATLVVTPEQCLCDDEAHRQEKGGRARGEKQWRRVNEAILDELLLYIHVRRLRLKCLDECRLWGVTHRIVV